MAEPDVTLVAFKGGEIQRGGEFGLYETLSGFDSISKTKAWVAMAVPRRVHWRNKALLAREAPDDR